MTFLRASGGCLLPPLMTTGEHYMSWREMASQAYNQTVEIPQLDHGLSVSYTYEGDSMCNKEFCRKVFQSRADRDRHEKLIHSELR